MECNPLGNDNANYEFYHCHLFPYYTKKSQDVRKETHNYSLQPHHAVFRSCCCVWHSLLCFQSLLLTTPFLLLQSLNFYKCSIQYMTKEKVEKRKGKQNQQKEKVESRNGRYKNKMKGKKNRGKIIANIASFFCRSTVFFSLSSGT